MPTRLTGLLCGGVLLMSAVPAFAADAVNVRVRIEGASRTLVKERRVTLADAPIIKDGDPAHACNGQTALGALQAGTQGNWAGSFSEGLGYFVSAIMGEKPAGSDYFQLWVNHRESTTGFCDTKLAGGQNVLIFRQTCTYDAATMLCPNTFTPLGLRVAKVFRRGHVRTVQVVAYGATGSATLQRGATVYVNGRRLGRTNKAGAIAVKATKVGFATIRAFKSGHVRSETASVRVVA